MIKATLADIRKNPINYLYVFAPDNFIDALGSKTAKIIRQKKLNQAKLLRNAAEGNNSTYDVWRDAVYNSIVDMYGMKPAEILVALAEGKDVAGKNWSKGVYGIGAVRQVNYNQNRGVTVDTKTGKIIGEGITNLSPIYSNGGKITGYSATDAAGNVYTSAKHGGNYYANTYGTAEVQQYANGQTYQPSESSTIWESIATFIPYVKNLLSWILSLFNVNTSNLITYENTYPSQQEFTYSSGLSSSELLMLAGGAAVVFAVTQMKD